MSLGNLDALGAIATVLNPNNNDEFPDGTVEQETIIVTSADGQILEEAYIITQEHPHQTQDTGQLQQTEEMEGETFCDLDQSTKEAGSNFLCSQQLQPRLIKNELKTAWETQLSESGFVACSVPGCQMKYSTVASFEDHYKFCTGENGQGVETCEYCNCEFLTCIQGIEDHVRKEHPTEINDYCAKRVARKIIKECREKEQRAKELKEAKALELKRERQNNRNSYQRNRPTCYAKKTPAKSDSDNSKDGSDRKVRFQKVVSVIHTAKQGPENDNDEGDVDDPGMTPTKDKARKGPPPRKDTTEVLQLARNWGVQRKTYSRSGSSADMPPGSRDSSIFDDDPEPETSTIPEKKVIEPPEPVVETPTVVQQQIQQDEEVVTFFNEDEDGNVLIPIETEGCVTVGNNEETPEAEDENYQLVIVTGESGESQYIVIDDSISQALADGVTLNDNSELQGSENSCFNVVTMPDEEIEVASTYDAEVEVTGEEVAETVPNDVPETATIQDIENDVGQVVIPSSQPSEPIVIPAKANKKVAFVESKPSEEATDDLLSSMPSADKWVERNRKSVENKKVVIRKRKVKTTPHMESGSEDSNDPTVDRFQLPTPKDLASINIGDDFLPPNLDKLLEFGSGRSEKKKTDISSEGGGSSPIRQSDVNGSWVEPPPRTASPKPSAKTHTAIILKNSVPSIPKMNPSNVKNVSVSTALKSAFVQEKAKLVEVVSQPTKVVTKTDAKIVPAQTASVSQIPQPAQASSKPHIVHLSQTPRNAQAAQTPAQKLQSTPSTQVPKSGLPLSDKSITSDNQNRTFAEKLEPSTANISKTAFVQENVACTPTCANKNSSMTKVITTNIESSPHHQEESRTSNTSESSSRSLPQMKKITSFQGLSGLTGNPHIKIYTPNSDGTLAPLEDFSILSSNPQIRIMTPETDGTLKPMIVGDNKDLILKTVQKMIATGSSSGTIKTHDNKISVLPEIGDGGQQHEIDIDTAAEAAAVGLEENEENNSRSAIEPLANSDGQTSNSIAIHEAKNEELIRIENELMKGPLTPSSVENENSIDVNSINTVGSSVTVETVVKRKRGRPPRIDSSTPKVLPTNTAPVHVLRASKPVSPPPSKIFKPNIGRNDTRMTLVNNSSDLSLLESTMDESLSNDFGNIKSTSNVSKQTSFASVLDSVSDSDSSNLTPASRRGGPAMRGGRYAKRRGGRRGRYAGRWRKPETPPADLPRQQMELEADSYKCSACKQVFLIKSLARSHIISRHNGMARLNDDTPMTESEINAALRMVLKTKRSLVCLNQDCGRVFRSGPGYLNHRKLCGVEVAMIKCDICKEEVMEPKYNAHKLKHAKELKRQATESDTEDMNDDDVPLVKKRTTRRAALMANSRLEEFVKAERVDEDGKEISDSEHDADEETLQSEGEGKPNAKDKDYTAPDEESEKSDDSSEVSMDEMPEVAATHNLEWFRNKLEKDWANHYRKPTKQLVDAEQKRQWKTELQQNNYISCKNEGCNKRLLSISACVKHQQLCGDEAFYVCLLCTTSRPAKCKSAKKFYMHLKKHKKSTSSAKTDGQPKNIGYRKYFEVIPQARKAANTGSLDKLELNQKLTKYAFKFYENHHTAETFSGFRPLKSDWMLVNNPNDYLPKDQESVNFKIQRLNDDSPTSWSKLKLFEVFESKSEPVEHITFNAGGPVWASAWCPTPLTEAASKETEQHAAISVSLDPDNEHKMTDIAKCKGLIQIWNFGNLNNKILKSTPRLVLAIGHNYGEIRDMQWCPSGCWDQPDETFQTQAVLPRMGLLAVACGDGCVRVLSIPHPDSLDHDLAKSSKNTSKIYVTNPVFLMNAPESGIVSTSIKSCCTSIAFEKTDGHGKLAAGYGNGLVSLWDLRSNSPLVVACRRRPASRGVTPLPQTLRPFHIFQAHSASVSALTFSCVPNGRFIATCGFDRITKIWDLDDTSLPYDTYKKSLGRDIAWSCHWAGYFMAIDDAYNITTMNSIFKECGYFDVGHVSVSNHNSCIWKTSISDWLNCEATCDAAGAVNMTVLPLLNENIQNLKSLKGKRWPIYTTKLCPLVEELGGTKNSESLETDSKKKGSKSTSLCLKNDPSLFAYNTREKITQKYGLVFVDAPLSSYNQLSSPEARSMTHLENIPELYPGQYQIASVNNVSWNPNLGSQCWILSAGQSGLVRLSCFSALKVPSINRLLAKVSKDNERT